ncbi:DUF6508 domain-containing protein [Paenibacillus sp. 1001270B_150601_E10]|uniref:DUF6508 domain-containing protein n=1 Tax=Paenibacillus sp. 1001270B_150601_E10 TaxID=2787079 RepID=UPI00189D857E|nr:DUF6508 domain-containing protein [Paenibacillus sp. 1001270B_150601_E10]
MTYHSDLTTAELNRLSSFLEYFQDPNQEFYRIENGYVNESKEVGEFRNALNDTGFLLLFDWHAWLSENDEYRDLEHDIQDKIMSADLETLRKLMTSYIRGDRFNEGLFARVCETGNVGAILRRVKDLLSPI